MRFCLPAWQRRSSSSSAKEAETAVKNLEIYSGVATGSIFTNKPPYYRRKDLMDPTRMLDLFAFTLSTAQ